MDSWDEEKYVISSMNVESGQLNIVEQYTVGSAEVFITSEGRYMVREPRLSGNYSELYSAIIRKINIGVGLGEDDSDPAVMADKLETSFWETAKRLNRYEEARAMFADIKYYILRDLIGYGILDVLMRDENIEDILCSSYGKNVNVVHKKYSGRFHSLETNIRFVDIKEMERFIQRVYGRTGTEPTESQPISVTYMADGSRISATYGTQISKPGPVIAIRKFPSSPLTITQMIEGGTLTSEMAAYIWTLLDAKAVGLVIGVTGSGKTTLLSSFVSMMNPRWRILTIEDTLELQIPHDDWVRYNTRKSYGMLAEKYDIKIRHLIDSSLTQKPDYEIIGEIRIDDLDMLFQSVGTGHGGLTSFHASSPEGAITRMRGRNISDGEIALVWFTVHSAVVTHGGRKYRKVVDVSEVTGDKDTGRVSARRMFRYDIFGDKFVSETDLSKSERYQEAMQVCGILDPAADMKKRIALLDECVSKKAHKIEEVFDILGSYYS